MMKTSAAAVLAALGAALTMVAPAAGAPARPADTVLRNGFVYTVDARDSVREAVAIRAGRIVYVGSDRGARRHVGPRTRVVNLRGRMAMPGLHDGHLHPLFGGANLLKCNLDYAPLTVAQLQARISACLRDTASEEPNGWLEVVGWYLQFIQPPGTAVSKATLDSLDTTRPILVGSTDGHTGLANTRALQLAGITAATPDPPDGRIERDASGNPTGVLQDGAQQLVSGELPPPTAAADLAAARAALAAMRRQGVTTFMDAWPTPPGPILRAFARIRRRGGLTARAHFAPEVTVDEAGTPRKAIRRLNRLARRYGDRRVRRRPGLTVRNAKLFTDGVLQFPAQTGALLQPYLTNVGGQWVQGTSRGELYFQPGVLNRLVRALAVAGWDPHIHAIGDRAVRTSLDAFRAMRRAGAGRDTRAAIAHAELVDPADFDRFRRLDVTPVMSFQWAKPGPDSIDAARDYLGPERFSRLEPEGSLRRAGTRIAFGSDWPVDPLDEWYALEVGVTRRNRLGAQFPQYAGRLNAEAGLSRRAVIRAATINAAHQLHQDGRTGSLERGKLADLIVLDRNVLRVRARTIGDTRVLMTMVGGRVVHRSRRLR